jgi:hypothetical protein
MDPDDNIRFGNFKITFVVVLAEGTSLRGYHNTDKAANVYSSPQQICRAEPPKAYAEIFVADAGGVTANEPCVGAAA